jgi:hypothetical protein
MMRRRGRPLLRSAVVVGGSMAVGGAIAKSKADSQAREQAQNQQIAELQEQQAATGQAPPPQYQMTQAPAPPVAAAPAVDPMERLKKLGELHDAGVLSDTEFAVEKQKILSSL